MIFQFYIGGYFSGHFEVILKKDILHVYESDYPLPRKYMKPTHRVSIKDDADWQQLLDFLNTLNWKARYEAEILDGIQWSLKYRDGDRRLYCEGSNAFPEEFEELRMLIKKITGKFGIEDGLVKRFEI